MPYQQIPQAQDMAIMPHPTSAASEVLEIVAVQYAGAVFIQLIDGRMFATIGGKGLDTAGFIVPATDEHRACLAKKKPAAG